MLTQAAIIAKNGIQTFRLRAESESALVVAAGVTVAVGVTGVVVGFGLQFEHNEQAELLQV